MGSRPEFPQGWGRVLSIQSHTVSGYVGNKSAVFPLQLLGFDVDPINSVQFSNHTGYPSWKGQVLNGDQLWDLIQGLESNNLLFYTHLLTGYIGSASFLETILRVAEKLRSVNPDLIYVCDPVMGDEGRLYINPQLVPIYQQKVIPIASLITPNQFEMEQLTGISIKNESDAIDACNKIHKTGPSKIVITSMNLEPNYITLIGSEKIGENSKYFRIRVPKLPYYFTGAGDLLTALLLGWSHKHPNDLTLAAELSIASLQAILLRTADVPESVQGRSIKGRELRLVQGRDDIIHPVVKILSEKISL